MNCIKYKSIIGDIYIEADDYWIYKVSFFPLKETKPNTIIKKTINQLDEYFYGKRKIFDLPLNPIGTEFQKKVWNELIKIPYGETKTYKDIAVNIGRNNASRAVGNANNKNPIAIIIPCHRVIGSDKKLTGYRGGLDKKRLLLNIENPNFCFTE